MEIEKYICISYQSLLYVFSYHLHAIYILVSAGFLPVMGLRFLFVYLSLYNVLSQQNKSMKIKGKEPPQVFFNE